MTQTVQLLAMTEEEENKKYQTDRQLHPRVLQHARLRVDRARHFHHHLLVPARLMLRNLHALCRARRVAARLLPPLDKQIAIDERHVGQMQQRQRCLKLGLWFRAEQRVEHGGPEQLTGAGKVALGHVVTEYGRSLFFLPRYIMVRRGGSLATAGAPGGGGGTGQAGRAERGGRGSLG